MKRKHLLPLLFAISFMVTFFMGHFSVAHAMSSTSRGDEQKAIEIGGTLLKRRDIKLYLEATRLSDKILSHLFLKAKKDYSQFKKIKNQWLNDHFEEGLKQLAYVMMIQKYATKDSLNQSERIGFKTTKKEFQKKIEEIEELSLKNFLDQGKGIRWAQSQFGKALKAKGYPHSSSISNKDLYFKWFRLQKRRLKESFRLREVQKFERFKVLGAGEKNEMGIFSIRPQDIFSFFQKTSSLIEEKVTNKEMSSQRVSSLLKEAPEFKVLLKKINFLGPETTRIKTLKEKAPQVLNNLKQYLNNKTLPFIKEKFSKKSLCYETMAQEMALKYKGETKTLEDLAKKMKERFLSSGDYAPLMMSKIYELAIVGIQTKFYEKEKEKQQSQRNSLGQYTKDLSGLIAQKLTQIEELSHKFKQFIRPEDMLSHEIEASFNEGSFSEKAQAIKGNTYLNKARKLIHWVARFQVKKASLQVTPLVIPTLYDEQSAEGQQRIREFLKTQSYQEKLTQFKRGELSRYWTGLIEIYPNERESYGYRDEKALDFIFQELKSSPSYKEENYKEEKKEESKGGHLKISPKKGSLFLGHLLF